MGDRLPTNRVHREPPAIVWQPDRGKPEGYDQPPTHWRRIDGRKLGQVASLVSDQLSRLANSLAVIVQPLHK